MGKKKDLEPRGLRDASGRMTLKGVYSVLGSRVKGLEVGVDALSKASVLHKAEVLKVREEVNTAMGFHDKRIFIVEQGLKGIDELVSLKVDGAAEGLKEDYARALESVAAMARPLQDSLEGAIKRVDGVGEHVVKKISEAGIENLKEDVRNTTGRMDDVEKRFRELSQYVMSCKTNSDLALKYFEECFSRLDTAVQLSARVSRLGSWVFALGIATGVLLVVAIVLGAVLYGAYSGVGSGGQVTILFP